MNYYPKESEITRYTVNGEDNVNALTQNVRKTTYHNKISTDSQNTAAEIILQVKVYAFRRDEFYEH
jgi:hypothetical protein